MLEQTYANELDTEDRLVPLAVDREVVSCKTCRLVQYRTRTDKCRRCERPLPAKPGTSLLELQPRPEIEMVRRAPETKAIPSPRWRSGGKSTNLQMVEGIGRRIQQFRELRGLTQNELQDLSRVSRSYLSRIEIGQMTPSLGTLEKISKALDISLNRFFAQSSASLEVLEDSFIQELQPMLKQLTGEQRKCLLRRIALIGVSTACGEEELTPVVPPKPIRAITDAPSAPF